MNKLVQKIYRPGIDGPALAEAAPRTAHAPGPGTETTADYSIRIVDRGEQLSYIDTARGEVVVEISIPGNWIDADSIRQWDRARAVDDADKPLILERIVNFWKRPTGIEPRVIHAGRP